jgi:hypothetical protein
MDSPSGAVLLLLTHLRLGLAQLGSAQLIGEVRRRRRRRGRRRW